MSDQNPELSGVGTMTVLTSMGDQNYALRDALKAAARKMQDEVYDWSPERTALAYQALCDGLLVVDLMAIGYSEAPLNNQILEHGEIEPRC